MEISNLLGYSEYVENVGKIYPIKLKYYDIFSELSDLLHISKKNFESVDLPLLILIIKGLEANNIPKKDTIKKMIGLFNLVLRLKVKCLECNKEYEYGDLIISKDDNKIIEKCPKCFSEKIKHKIQYIETDYFIGFKIRHGCAIYHENYEEVRKIIMNQNVLFEPKIFKDKIVQEWANKALLARAKNGADITFEDIVDTVHVFSGLSYKELGNETIYQIKRDFERICKIKSYDTNVLLQTVDTKKRNISHFAEKIKFKNPYEDLFVSKDKFKNVNKIFNKGGR